MRTPGYPYCSEDQPGRLIREGEVIIDFHTHATAVADYGEEGSFETFVADMDENGIDIAVLVSKPGANEYVYELMQRYPGRLMALAGLNPLDEKAPELLEHYVRDFGFKGVKLHPLRERFYLTDPGLAPLIKKTIELDVPILIHTGPLFNRPIPIKYDDPVAIDDLALSFPEAKIVMAHGNPMGVHPVLAGKHPNVYMDTTIVFARWARIIPGLGEETIKWMSLGTEDGTKKLIFGSDARPVRTYRWKQNLEPIKNLKISEEAKARILGGNAAKLLKL